LYGADCFVAYRELLPISVLVEVNMVGAFNFFKVKVGNNLISITSLYLNEQELGDDGNTVEGKQHSHDLPVVSPCHSPAKPGRSSPLAYRYSRLLLHIYSLSSLN
jgi:hypothetical protein